MAEVNVAQALQDELAAVLQEKLSLSFDEATKFVSPIVGYLQQQYGGDELYIPRPGRTYPMAEILAARERMSVSEVCRRFSISRRQYYNLMAQAGDRA